MTWASNEKRPLIEPTSLFSAVEGQTSRSRAASPAPATNPFQAPDFGEDDAFPLDDLTEQPAPSGRPARRRAA
ncbi:hypothetical protein K4G64_34785 [Streptomyces sp. WAC04114]|nr:hypothetical protein [Streptomyces sp. WAC04114]